MLTECDAALIIGDPALFLDPVDLASRLSRPEGPDSGIQKIDLGEQWTAMTGLPFVWAFWAGRPDALDVRAVQVLLEARDAGVRASDQLAADYCGPDRAAVGKAYLRDNIQYTARRAAGSRSAALLLARGEARSHRRGTGPDLLPGTMTNIDEIAAKVRGGRTNRSRRGDRSVPQRPTALLGELADGIRARKHPAAS